MDATCYWGRAPYSSPVTSVSARPRFIPIVAPVGAFVSVLAVYAGPVPGPLLTSLHGTSISAVVVFAAFTVCGLWVLRKSSASAWRWATGIGAIVASAQIAGMSLRTYDGLVQRLVENLAWVMVHWFGTAWMLTCALAALIGAIDSYGERSSTEGSAEPAENSRVFARLVDSLRCTDRPRRRRGWLTLMGIVVLSRIPYLIVYWPGIVAADTFRSLTYARGMMQWQSYEPVGESLFISVIQWLGNNLGWGDSGVVAIGAITLILASSAAITFMFVRMAIWGLPRTLWVATLAWILLLPIFGYYSLDLVKDVPFSIAMLVFLVCIGELSFGNADTVRKLWPWVTMAVAGVAVIGTRNNGIHVIALSLPLLIIPLRSLWKRILILLTVLVAAYGVYVGPVYAMLDVQPGPKEESYSVPLQQLGRIAKYRSTSLSAADRKYFTHIFAGMPPEELAKHYVPGLADPMKLQARKAWPEHSTIEFIAGWLRIAAKYPVTAIEATLANTVGYWDPEAPSYDGVVRWSANDWRGIHLDIPSGKPTTGIAGKIEASGIAPTHSYVVGTHDDGYRVIPIVGLAMSPGPVCWLWFIGGLLVARRRIPTALAVFVPAAVLLLTFLAGPISGGQRYSLTLFMALPLAVAAVVLSARRNTRVTSSPDATTDVSRRKPSHSQDLTPALEPIPLSGRSYTRTIHR